MLFSEGGFEGEDAVNGEGEEAVVFERFGVDVHQLPVRADVYVVFLDLFLVAA